MTTTSSSPPPSTRPGKAQDEPVALARPLSRAAQTKRFAEHVARADARPVPSRGDRAQAGRAERAASPSVPSAGKAQVAASALRRKDEDAMPGAALLAGGEKHGAAHGMPVEQAAPALIDPGQIERMAAAIAEIAADGAQARYAVEFPPGQIASGALIARDATGAMVLRILGLDPSRQNDRLRGELAAALSRRRMRVSRIDFGDAGNRVRPLANR